VTDLLIILRDEFAGQVRT